MSSPVADRVESATRILVATNEPWGAYHSTALREHYKQPVLHVVPTASVAGESLTLEEVRKSPGDILLIGGAGKWPAAVAAALPGTPTFAVRLAYLGVAPRLDVPAVNRFWAATTNHAGELAAEFMVEPETVEITAYPWVTAQLVYEPAPRSVLLVTSVSEADHTGGAAAEANSVLRAVGHTLTERFDVTVALHPRESPAHWAGFKLAQGRTVPAASTAAVVVAVAETVLEQVHQLQVPIVVIPTPGVPAHILELGVVASTHDAVIDAVLTATHGGG